MWDEFLKRNKNANPFKTRTLPYFEDLSMIYGKDRATRKDTQTTIGVIEDLEREENDHGGTI
ncbi:hypothetical protein Goarm_005246 [Gossypium armourianum]|uniref:Uncharacterized protein n=1 Tax=Gossypium armourianum TaxID=34283 RepID=A0A7J9JZD3_9ROSI|nr:hypothetical protein [Gossypium armourianum]